MFKDIQKKKVWKEENERPVFLKISKDGVWTMSGHLNNKKIEVNQVAGNWHKFIKNFYSR